MDRDVLGASGQDVSGSNLQMSYTIGEPFTLTLENSAIHTLGYQQPEKPATELPFAIPGGLSPNGDGNNDSWDIQGLVDYLMHRLRYLIAGDRKYFQVLHKTQLGTEQPTVVNAQLQIIIM